MKKILLIFLILFFLFNFVGFIFGGGIEGPRPLEVEYPKITPAPIEIPATVDVPIPVYARYIYYFIIGISGLIAFGALIYGGLRYLTSAGNPEALKDAKNQILAAFLGIIILLSSYLILYTIDPQLVVLEVPALKVLMPHLASGVWLCKGDEDLYRNFYFAYSYIRSSRIISKELAVATEKEKERLRYDIKKLYEQTRKLLSEIHKQCYLVEGLGNIREDFDNKVTQAHLVPEKINDNEYRNYAAFIFEDPAFKGKLENWHRRNIYQVPVGGMLHIKKPSSIMPLIINPNPDPDWKVITYEEVNSNEGFAEGVKDKQTFPDECERKGEYWCFGRLNPSPKSIENPGGAARYIAVLSKGATEGAWREESEVFGGNDSNLLDNERITAEDCALLGIFRCKTIPAAKAIFLISGSIY